MNIPKIGLGTWLIDSDKVGDVIKNAIEVGYRHIDTAQAYENEEGISVDALCLRMLVACGYKEED